MSKSTNTRYETLSAALAIIDPDAILAPGTAQHNALTEKILAWMAEMNADEVLRESAKMQRVLKFQRNLWQ